MNCLGVIMWVDPMMMSLPMEWQSSYIARISEYVTPPAMNTNSRDPFTVGFVFSHAARGVLRRDFVESIVFAGASVV